MVTLSRKFCLNSSAFTGNPCNVLCAWAHLPVAFLHYISSYGGGARHYINIRVNQIKRRPKALGLLVKMSAVLTVNVKDVRDSKVIYNYKIAAGNIATISRGTFIYRGVDDSNLRHAYRDNA
jgi:hypothetical protein